MTIDQKTEQRISRLENDRDSLYDLTAGIDRKLDSLTEEFRGFKAEMTDFKTEMTDFKAEMRAFQAEMRAFQAEVLRRLPAPPEA